MWIDARNLVIKLNGLLQDVSNDALLAEVLGELNKNAERLRRPLTNRPRSATDRARVTKIGEEIVVPGGQKVIIEDQLRNEAVIVSELFQINEIDALELLLTGELQTGNMQGLSRGLCAVACYYDQHRYYLLALKTLLVSLADTEAHEELPSKMRSFIAGLVADEELYFRIMTLLSDFSVQREFERLNQPNVNGLGGPQHQRILTAIISDMESYCYEIICLLSRLMQPDKVSAVLPRLFSAVEKFVPESTLTVPQLAMWTALLLFVHPSSSKHGAISSQLQSIFREHLKNRWEHPCLRATIELAFGVFLKSSRLAGGGRDIALINDAVNGLAFKFMYAYVARIPDFAKYTFSFEVLDFTVKTFISNFPDKLCEMFNMCEEELFALDKASMDDSAITPQRFPLHFNALLELITEMYRPSTPRTVEHSEQYFDRKFEGLCNFVVSGKAISAPAMFVIYMNMLQALCKTERSSIFLFNFFRQADDSPYSWDKLFRALRKYLELFRNTPALATPMVGFPAPTAHQAIQPSELAGILAWLRLAEAVISKDPEARRQIYEDRGYNCIETMVGMLTAGFPVLLKGAVYRFLAAMATDERASVHIWNSMFHEGVCGFHAQTGRLTGIQQELEEKECPIKNYDCSCGFLRLMKQLFSQRAVPSGQQLAPYLQFITKSIIGQFAMRSYDDVSQMWDMATTALDALTELLKRFVVTDSAVQTMAAQVTVLYQLLNDSPLSQSVSRIVLEVADRIEDCSPQNVHREALGLSAIRLLWSALAHRTALAEAIRATDSTVILSSVEALLLSPISMRPSTSYISLLTTFVSNDDTFAKHTFYVVKILRELCSTRPSLQTRIVYALLPKRQALIETLARVSSVTAGELETAPLDLPPHYVDEFPVSRVRGETVRQIVEAFIDSLEVDSSSTNVAYFLLGLNLQDIRQSVLKIVDSNGEALTCLRSFVDLLEIFIASPSPFDLPYSALFEPVLRLMHRLLGARSAASDVVLRYLRSESDIIYRLMTCPTFRLISEPSSEEPLDETFSRGVYYRTIQGLILQLAAIELCSLLRTGHIGAPEKFLAALLSERPPFSVDDTFRSDDTRLLSDNIEERPILWRLLEASMVSSSSVSPPVLDKFDSSRIEELLKMCMRPSTFGVQQYDVQHLAFLLALEVSSIVNDEIVSIEEEQKEILTYCTDYNAKRLLEASCVRLLSGWVACVNVLASFAPLPFLDMEVQKSFLADGLSLLADTTRTAELNNEVLNAISSCMFRLVRAICQVSLAQSPEPAELKPQLAKIVTVLVETLTTAGYNGSLRLKMDLYGSLLCVFDTCAGAETENAPPLTETERAQKRCLASLLDETGFGTLPSRSPWNAAFSQQSAELVNTMSSDITYSPFALKIAAISTLSNILRESVDAENIAFQLARSGTLRCILESLVDIKPALLKDVDSEEGHEAITYLLAVTTMLVRLSSTSLGWTALMDNAIFTYLQELDLWTNPPVDVDRQSRSKDVFLKWILSPLKPPLSASAIRAS